jgi:Uma2 family endonuclease
MSSATVKPDVEYPSGDGQPMAETPVHVDAIMLLHQALEDFFRGREDVFIASDIFWYWEEGNPDARISPDVMVALGVPRKGLRDRNSFFSWEENGAVPSVVFEMASAGTWREDLGGKFWRYEELGVREYFLFDPQARHLVPPLQGFRLNRTAYRRLLADDDVLESELGFRLRAEDTMLRLIDAKTGRPVPTRAEAVEREKRRADGLAAEVERLKALLNRQGPADGAAP